MTRTTEFSLANFTVDAEGMVWAHSTDGRSKQLGTSQQLLAELRAFDMSPPSLKQLLLAGARAYQYVNGNLAGFTDLTNKTFRIKQVLEVEAIP